MRIKRRTLLKSSALGLAATMPFMGAAARDPVVRVRHSGTSLAVPDASLAYRWTNVLLDTAAVDVRQYGARPTVLARAMGIVVSAMYEAWAAYDDTAQGAWFGTRLKRPASERTLANQEEAISYAVAHALRDVYPESGSAISAALLDFGYDPDGAIPNALTPAGIGTLIGETITGECHRDGANQLGDEPGSSGNAYSDYTQYNPVNPPDRILHPDRWQPITFRYPDGSTFAPGFLTPHWYRVNTFALTSSDQFRAPPPPLVGSDELLAEVQQVLDFNAGLTNEQKAIVEFMRDGPGSTGQSGHWLRFAQDVSRRDRNGLDEDVKLFFSVGMAAHDAFIAAWDSKRHYDSARPWTLVRHYFADQTIRGWGGPGRGTIELPGSEWYPYSPYDFVSPPFPGYVSGHSAVSACCAEVLRLVTGDDEFGAELTRIPGEITEPEALGEEVRMVLTTFTATADMAGISRIYGGYHIEADNREGLLMGRRVAAVVHDRAQELFGA